MSKNTLRNKIFNCLRADLNIYKGMNRIDCIYACMCMYVYTVEAVFNVTLFLILHSLGDLQSNPVSVSLLVSDTRIKVNQLILIYICMSFLYAQLRSSL